MKRIIFLLFAFLPFLAFSQKAQIQFESNVHNFGTVEESGGNVTHDFVFRNTGQVPLIISNVRTTCGCTTPEWSRQPIPPGASGVIKVGFNPQNRPGNFTKGITVNSNAETPVSNLTIRGTVNRRPADPYASYTFSAGNLKLAANTLNFGSVKNTDKPVKEIAVVNTGDKPIELSFENVPAAFLTVTSEPAVLEKNRPGRIRVTYDVPARKEWGFVSDKFTVKTNVGTSHDVTVMANISEDFSEYVGRFDEAPKAVFSDRNADLGTVEKNVLKKHELYIENTGKHDLIIRKIGISDESRVKVSPAKTVIKPGKKIKVELSIQFDDKPGRKVYVVSFTLNDPASSHVTYRIGGNVQSNNTTQP
ncbi:MAG: DUF1573 domain-containing protein [Culturomica sp.]|jgi:hypothetical protein|nr:DUF1573 domain-containing protein [Culturomica sp.]